jgi:hypothetical protein
MINGAHVVISSNFSLVDPWGHHLSFGEVTEPKNSK